MAQWTPWGESDHFKPYSADIAFYSTASHGGFKVLEPSNAKIPRYLRRPDGWYEEDCDWAIVATIFPELFDEENREAAKKSLRNWDPDGYEMFYGVTIPAGESIVKDERAFKLANASNYVVVAAWGDWKEGIPKGMVGCYAQLGEDRMRNDGRYFLVPKEEYRGSFVIDLTRHTEIAPIV